MSTDVYRRYEQALLRLEQTMADALAPWPWDTVGPLHRIVRQQTGRGGKRLRPLVALAMAEHLGGDAGRVVAPAASVEFYHVASLVLDDVQDNSAVRRDAPTVHTTAGVSTAINVAALIRSMSYHAIHGSAALRPGEKLLLHEELDEAATRLVLGQSIDIGWNSGWYPAAHDFPYQRMLEWKTGSLFGCSAAMAAVIAGAEPEVVDEVRAFGVEFGVLYQMIDDVVDVFGGGSNPSCPDAEDLRGAKLTAPIICLLDTLDGSGRHSESGTVLQRMVAAPEAATWRWVAALMDECGILATLREQLRVTAERLTARLPGLGGAADRGPANGLRELIATVMAPVTPGPTGSPR